MTNETPSHAAEKLAENLAALDLEARLRHISRFAGRTVFTTSLGIEDQVITTAIARSGAASSVEIVTLDTGRLFDETRELIEETERRFALSIERYRPAPIDVEDYKARYGIDGFYESVEARHACCEIRKLRPLALALDRASIWITGVRRGQSGARAQTPLAEFDAQRDLIKVNPLADMTLDAIEAYARTHDVPLNPLHARSYPSIGCEPCTRAIKPGEPERAGRWWWEQDQTRECGLHVKSSASSPVILPASPKVSVPIS
ncbi:phosphoadenylyl-sulfate reductase [Aliihoeflea aestuarii]|nr:phosphoadenylyl-sulfate reductase [Aliihoeflea aestuarii]MCO6393314.1 phosphoadenylyl-sulfate reductase [Aliihoeflea aestuarii]